MLKPLNQNPYVIVPILLSIAVAIFAIAFMNQNVLCWILFVGVDVGMIGAIHQLIQLKKMHIIHQGRMNLHPLHLLVSILLIVSIFYFSMKEITNLEAYLNAISCSLLFFFVMMHRAIIPSVVIVKEGIMLHGSVHLWNNLDMLNINIIGDEFVRITPKHLPKIIFPAIRTDKTTVDILVAELNKRGYAS
ncbi:MAG: hypothetical protein P9L94_00685 [Candidatus Hinthialibacter antarcticus]|nr:hypothetical protein [Candidatus Hinthialibacter antarcticus]